MATFKIKASDARRDFKETLARTAKGDRAVIYRHGRIVGVVVSPRDLALLHAIEDKHDLEAAREALEEPGSIPWEQVKADLGL